MMGEPFQSVIFDGLPPMAVPMTVKMPEPMTAPMPSAVRETGPSVLRRAFSGSSDSEISLSMDFVAKICRASSLAPGRQILLRRGVMGEASGAALCCRPGSN
jgi:hypothetical protein